MLVTPEKTGRDRVKRYALSKMIVIDHIVNEPIEPFMSHRCEQTETPQMDEHPDGEWVRWSDIEKLRSKIIEEFSINVANSKKAWIKKLFSS